MTADMNTLSNVGTRRGEANPPSVRPVPDTIPKVKNTKTGVSVEYVPDAEKRWFVFRASYGREDKAADFLIEHGTYAYVAKRYVRKSVNNMQEKVLESLIPGLLFVYTTAPKAEEYVQTLAFLSYYYNHFVKNAEGKNPPLTITCQEMENFILATCNHSEHLLQVNVGQCHFKGGETVKVINGMFRGVVGRVVRVAGQQRIFVSLSNVGSICTAYVPKAFLEVVNCP